uniref:Uncharacterized protein n=1 Tax=Arundo donax TaxID=35708 RepID=A0A0A9H970_ARUDO
MIATNRLLVTSFKHFCCIHVKVPRVILSS